MDNSESCVYCYLKRKSNARNASRRQAKRMNIAQHIDTDALQVFVTSTSTDALNVNSAIRSYLVEGLRERVGQNAVAQAPLELACERVQRLRPKLVIAVGSLVPDAAGLGALRRAADAVGAQLAFWLTEDPYEFDYAFKAEILADVVFSNDGWATHHYRHGSVHHLPLAASPTRHLRRIRPDLSRDITVFFCGVAYPNRISLLRQADELLSRHPVEILGSDWPTDVRCASNRRLTADEMADHAAAAWLTLNIGRELDIANRRFALPQATRGRAPSRSRSRARRNSSSPPAWRSVTSSNQSGKSSSSMAPGTSRGPSNGHRMSRRRSSRSPRGRNDGPCGTTRTHAAPSVCWISVDFAPTSLLSTSETCSREIM